MEDDADIDPEGALEADDDVFATQTDDGRVTARFAIPPEQGGRRLDVALAALLPMHSRARLQRWLRSGELKVDGAAKRVRDRVLGGEIIELDAVLARDERWAPQAVPFEVVFEDAWLIVVDKPVGLVVHPGAGNPDGTLVNGLLHRYPELAGLPRAGIVHRLDKDTSGLLVVARTLEAHAALVAQLSARSVSREYLAVVENVPVSGARIEEPIGRDPRNRLRMAVVSDGREAITHFRVVERFRAHALVTCALETGRTHQIRVHLAHQGYPLVGDPLYGARGRLPSSPDPALISQIQGFRRQALHARRLRFDHPGSGESVSFEAQVPADLQQLLAALSADAMIER